MCPPDALGQHSRPKRYTSDTRACDGAARFWINGDKHDEKASSDRGRGPFDLEKDRFARGAAIRKDRAVTARARDRGAAERKWFGPAGLAGFEAIG